MATKPQDGLAAEDLRKVFVATSRETWDADWFVDALAAAHTMVQAKYPDIELLPWTTVFKTGDITVARLLELSAQVVGAVVVLAADDFARSRGKAQSAPRDNLIFEAGVFLNRLGMSNVLLLREKDSKWPTDLLGVTAKEFVRPPERQRGSTAIVASDIAKSMRQFVDNLPTVTVPSDALALGHSWTRMLRQANDLSLRLESPPAETPIEIADPL
jgi:predicted nucleotide-binding protein